MSNTLSRYDANLIALAVTKTVCPATSIQHHLHIKTDRKFVDGCALNQQSELLQRENKTELSWGGVFATLMMHAMAMVWMVSGVPEQESIKPSKPVTVSLISPSTPEAQPEPILVPVIEPVKVQKKPAIKPKKVVERIVPVENLTQPVFEATTEPVVEDKPEMADATSELLAEQDVPKPSKVEEKVEPPKFGVAYLNNPPPGYPRMAKRAGEEGRVILKVLVSTTGAADTVEIEQSSGYQRLDQAALDAVRQWRFVPARKGGQVLSAYVLVPLKFSLSD